MNLLPIGIRRKSSRVANEYLLEKLITNTRRYFFGATYLLDAIAEKTGLTSDLKRCFPETYRQLLSLAYYLILEDSAALSRFSRWAVTHEHPYGSDIPSQRSTEILSSLDAHAKPGSGGTVQNRDTQRNHGSAFHLERAKRGACSLSLHQCRALVCIDKDVHT